VRFRDKVVGVVTKEGSPATSRRPGRLEQVYLTAAERVSAMICDGTFPFRPVPSGDWPRIGDGLLVLDEAGCISWASPNALSSLRQLDVKHNILGRALDELGLGETPVGSAMANRRLLDGELSRGDSHVILRVVPLIQEGKSVGCLILSRDVSEIRQKERVISVKDATIREIHHRVKNNLQTIASLLRLQARRLRTDEAKGALQESVLRIGAIALVHETLSEDPGDVVEFADVARRIGYMVAEGLVAPDIDIDLRVDGATGRLTADLATPLAVTLAELLQNAIEHAFPGRPSGCITIDLARENGDVVIVVKDDGIGIREEAFGGGRLGLQIVNTLIAEMGGKFTIGRDGGTCAEVRVPADRR